MWETTIVVWHTRLVNDICKGCRFPTLDTEYLIYLMQCLSLQCSVKAARYMGLLLLLVKLHTLGNLHFATS